ncbi:MAG: hypothetical protein OXC46_00205, partial [Thaumarchaeota archaeon]|nr:hypothetical protein [Nitrososphaerota archaeon]
MTESVIPDGIIVIIGMIVVWILMSLMFWGLDKLAGGKSVVEQNHLDVLKEFESRKMLNAFSEQRVYT